MSDFDPNQFKAELLKEVGDIIKTTFAAKAQADAKQAEASNADKETAQERDHWREKARNLQKDTAIKEGIRSLGIDGIQAVHASEWLSNRVSYNGRDELVFNWEGKNLSLAEGLDRFAQSEHIALYKPAKNVSGANSTSSSNSTNSGSPTRTQKEPNNVWFISKDTFDRALEKMVPRSG